MKRTDLIAGLTLLDLDAAMVACVKQGKFDDATFLYALSGVYGRYDILRVSDRTAHQAVTVLRMWAMSSLSDEEKARFKNEVLSRTEDNEARSKICKDVEKIGPPRYIPTYMTGHGLGAIVGSEQSGSTPEGFNSASAWHEALTGYLHCPSPTAISETRQFELNVVLLINREPHEISYNWRCTRIRDTANANQNSPWTIFPRPGPVLKMLGAEAAVLVTAPNYCATGAQEAPENDPIPYSSPVMIVDSVTDPFTIQVFTENYYRGMGYEVLIKSESMRRIDSATKDYEFSKEELSFRETVSKGNIYFQSVQARMEPKSMWGNSEAAMQFFSDKKGIVVADTPARIETSVAGRDGAHNFFPFDRAGIKTGRNLDRFSVPLRKVGDVWLLQPTDDTTSATTYVRVADDSEQLAIRRYGISRPPPVTVRYEGVAVPVIGSQEVYDADRELLIQFINGYRPIKTLGLFVDR
ncbi:hypothetical protein J2797_005107 [Paraburkholderia terricola]|uniref:hypothetical protein n=1 Tax=Paraburkholderia terricola TaxID=169427 RepID=UPI0028614312|nr:hypothetical protein [Paraburkholderia terricola]MDR6495191.1 hypothetical protein [Paraburkholderia terricola]